jgi:hypothetical protein
MIAYTLAHWIARWASPPELNWKAICRLSLETLFPAVAFSQALRQFQLIAKIATQFGFEIVLNPLS